MNLIQKQAEHFYQIHVNDSGDYKDFIQELRSQLFEYHKGSHKIEFIDRIIILLKKDYDIHLVDCEYRDKNRLDCRFNTYYENTLFFIQNEKDETLSVLEPSEFSISERNLNNESLDKIIDDLRKIQVGQELTYNDLYDELQELKEYYFLSKKHWSQLLIGRISEMVAGGVISETVSKEIVDTVLKNYPGLIN